MRRMLQVTVHDQDPGAAGDPGTGHDRARQTSCSLARRAVQQTDGDRAAGRQGRDLVHRAVVAVVDEKDLRVERGQLAPELVEQQRNALLLVAGGDQNGQPGCGSVAACAATGVLDAGIMGADDST